MPETYPPEIYPIEERRQQQGTRCWVILNLFLFPISAYFALLRVRQFTLKKRFLHLGVILLLLGILLVSAFLQVVLPMAGRLWMLLPMASGIVVILLNRGHIARFQPFCRTRLAPRQMRLLLFLVALLTLISVLPQINLIEMKDAPTAATAGMAIVPLWQRITILVIGTLVVFAGYATNTAKDISLNRLVILYACFFLIATQINILLFVAGKWLGLSGGVVMEAVAILLAAILALDYWDAVSCGQFTRRYALLTCTKMLSFIFLWLCFWGLPQKTAAAYLAHYYDHGKRPPLALPVDNLLFPDQGVFKSGHTALRRLRTLAAEALIGGQPEMLSQVMAGLEKNEALLCLAGDDVCRLKAPLSRANTGASGPAPSKLPFFRPMDEDWDVFFSALIRQERLQTSDLSEIVAAFKARLPKSAAGRLPAIETPYDAQYVALATDHRLDFVPPSMEAIDALLQKGRVPILRLPMAGSTRWSALLFRDDALGIAWFRVEVGGPMQAAIQTLFDAREAQHFRETILACQMVPLSLDYLATLVPQIGEPMLVMTPSGLDPELADAFGEKTLEEMKIATARVSQSSRTPDTLSESSAGTPESAFARYLLSVVQLYDQITPKALDEGLFPNPKDFNSAESWATRLDGAQAILRETGPLKDWDRIALAHSLEENQLAVTRPQLFLDLALPRPVSTNMVACQEAFQIGRRLYLMGQSADAEYYLSIAHARHPFNSKYELWHRLAQLKLDRKPAPLRVPPNRQAGLWLYAQTLEDIKNGRDEAARKRLEAVLDRDSHDCMANHLLSTYFQKPLNETYFYPSPEGL